MSNIICMDKIGCIGAGYVGGPTMAMIAYKCPNLIVYVCDKNKSRIDEWNSSNPPIYEPGLVDILEKTKNKNLFFTIDIEKVVKECDIIFISVNTPTKTYGIGKNEIPDLSMWEDCGRTIAKYSNRNKIIVEKSTVPVKTSDSLLEVLYSCRKNEDIEFTVLSNPEFLSEGTAISDLEYPDRVLIGGRTDSRIGQQSMNILKNIYENWIPIEKILLINVWSSELAKLAANAFLAQRLSSINSISRLCERTGAEINEISKAVGSDTRIGDKFLNSSVGFGGSCFKKDVLCLAYLFDHYNLKQDGDYWRSVINMNEFQKLYFSKKIIESMFGTLKYKKMAILGFSFKKNTGDVRETATTLVCKKLFEEGANLYIFDPCVKESDIILEFKRYGINQVTTNNEYKEENHIIISKNLDDAINKSHGIVFCTDWDLFKEIDFQKYYNLMQKPANIFDGRNFLDHSKLYKIGFNVHSVGNVSMIHSYKKNHSIKNIYNTKLHEYIIQGDLKENKSENRAIN